VVSAKTARLPKLLKLPFPAMRKPRPQTTPTKRLAWALERLRALRVRLGIHTPIPVATFQSAFRKDRNAVEFFGVQIKISRQKIPSPISNRSEV
jgi:hypothetical protein